MKPEEKIAKILEQIHNDSVINPDPQWVRFDFNYNMVGAGILSENEERRILFKLRKEGVIELCLSQFEDKEPKEISVISSEHGRKFLLSSYYQIELLDGFEEKYKAFIKYLKVDKKSEKSWIYYTNPIWLLCKLILFLWKHKFLSFVFFLFTLFAIDFTLAWKNFNWLLDKIGWGQL